MNKQIPLFNAEGRNLGLRALTAAMRLSQAGMAVLERNKKGYVVAAHLRGENGRNPIQQAPAKGDKYSFQQRVGGGMVWDLKHLAGGKGKNYAPVEAREAYVAVLNSIITG